ncbi:alpha/beta fold hydrolase [Sphingobium yanoikuyae]|uniref:Alpha/beta fold hydrolase n=1 Tax=Sphingobium yanoikuyae TaxID=13690 RepID=A0AA43B6J8_SPHYA|nr:alpha/beta hydrolase [Sphingobium yanoikuyae]MDH2130351.1 alpha/beta fold hydrolase [Sphingobium yanoikuyae]MDH2148307.1 alpha/beta fold hydrolase [Sphingobium yanoikuyae]MDH2165906.1 alpha/beta fold hydrolase [Sphingobium yanoikuyae]
MKMSGIISMAALALATPAIAREPAIHPAVTTDPAPDAANPARMDAFVIPSGEGAMNAVMYVAAGNGVHPTLLLLHGFPGNEQNLDLAQAARRAGWNVLTLHYRGSWGSPGIFSFTNAAEDAFNALLFLEEASTVAKYRIDTSAIVVAGHSMGGFMAAEAAAAEPRVAGLFLIDPWDPAQTVASLATPQGEAGWKAEVAGDLPPLSGASYESLTAEIKGDTQKFDLGRKLVGYGRRPLTIIGAERGIGAMARKVGADAQSANPNSRLMVWPTDHSFSDKRIALADVLVRFLAGVAPTLR